VNCWEPNVISYRKLDIFNDLGTLKDAVILLKIAIEGNKHGL
jgi:hypothetical protein